MQRKLFILACFFSCNTILGQQYSFERFIENGLSNNLVYATHQNSNGYLWEATHHGLNQYDGYEFTKFVDVPFASANSVYMVFQANKSNLKVLKNVCFDVINLT
jgi:ligand-binding sensor domain-containing protein